VFHDLTKATSGSKDFLDFFLPIYGHPLRGDQLFASIHACFFPSLMPLKQQSIVKGRIQSWGADQREKISASQFVVSDPDRLDPSVPKHWNIARHPAFPAVAAKGTRRGELGERSVCNV
jgi:hypothetical protein